MVPGDIITTQQTHQISVPYLWRLPRLLAGDPLKVNGAPGNIQGNLAAMVCMFYVYVVNHSKRTNYGNSNILDCPHHA